MAECNDARLKDVLLRYRQLEEAGMVPFHYGTHYDQGGVEACMLSLLKFKHALNS